jgi:putative peptide zinc metalloprotease protein
VEQPGGGENRLFLADGIELIGKYEGSGFKEAPYVARRADGQVVQMPRLLYLVAERCDGSRDCAQIAAEVSEAFGRGLAADQVQYLAQEKLVPLGVLAGPGGEQPQLQKIDPLLALRFRAAVVPQNVVNAITTVFRPAFFPLVVVGVLGGLVALDVWLFFFHGVAQSLRQTLYDPAFLLLLLGLVILSAAFHECGHATACRYGGATPGAMGVGIYIVWPAFYTDVTDAYRLGKAGRLRTDLGGVYFNVIFILATGAAYFLTGFEPLLLIIPIQHLEIIHQFLPFIRLDGYYIVSDLTGVPDMFARIKPTLKSLIPWREPDDRVTELKPWVRGAVTLYVFTVIPILLLMFGLMVMNAPRIFATAWDSFFVQYHKLGHGGALSTTMSAIQMGVLVLPSAGIVASFSRFGRRIGGAAWTRTEGRPAVRGAFVVATAVAAAFIGYIWWPNGDYRPIQPGERGTLQGGINEFANAPTGRPALTKQRARQLHGAPLKSSRKSRSQPAKRPPTSTGQTSTSTRSTSTSPTETSTQPSATTPTSTTTTSTSTTSTTSTTTPTTTTP